MRGDAWLLDPFGAGLGRWGGAPSGSAPAPAWYQPIVGLVGAGFVCVYTEGVETAAPGAQVTAWNDVRGGAVWTPYGATSTRPTLGSGGVGYDGIDDKLAADEYAPILDGAHTLLVGFDGALGTSTNRHVFAGATATSTTTASQVRLTYLDAASGAGKRGYYQDGTTLVQLSILALTGGTQDLVMRAAAPSGALSIADLATPGAPIASDTRPALSVLHTLLTQGALRWGASETLTGFWTGTIRYMILADTSLSNDQVATIRTALLTQTGLIT